MVHLEEGVAMTKCGKDANDVATLTSEPDPRNWPAYLADGETLCPECFPGKKREER